MTLGSMLWMSMPGWVVVSRRRIAAAASSSSACRAGAVRTPATSRKRQRKRHKAAALNIGNPSALFPAVAGTAPATPGPTGRTASVGFLLEFLGDARGLAGQVAQVVQLGLAHVAATLQRDAFDLVAVRLEGTLNTHTVGDLAYGEGRTQTTVALADDNAFEGLQTLAVAFLDAYLYHDGVAGAEFRHVGLHLCLFDFLDDLVAAAHVVLLRSTNRELVVRELPVPEQRLPGKLPPIKSRCRPPCPCPRTGGCTPPAEPAPPHPAAGAPAGPAACAR